VFLPPRKKLNEDVQFASWSTWPAHTCAKLGSRIIQQQKKVQEQNNDVPDLRIQLYNINPTTKKKTAKEKKTLIAY
jgi:hypothetical protein